uniref:Uncharacterized LOC100187018 n=1 Tax=Ciona intestinalis TaxID=7719 RepID=F6S2H9_CIOIN|nr:uncharacterized protein LOC100187018 [Ciona intestinalis]|eukprot:XP_002127284.1 uncharacterized protein LOC100187018 [Ciona intestinalis]
MVLILTLALLVTLCQGAVFPPPPQPPNNTRISWNDVRSTSFKVRWDDAPDAASYNVFLSTGINNPPFRTYVNLTQDHLWIRSVQPKTIYAVRVACVDRFGRMSAQGLPGRTRTFPARITTTTTPAPTAPTPVGACGVGNFTCDTPEKDCIDESWWCDKSKDCPDGSDEKNCPGACVEITEFSNHGNFSCSRFNSRMSACFFDCNDDFVRDGAWYTVCLASGWTRAVPTCRLKEITSITVINGRSDTEVPVQFPASAQASSYEVYDAAIANTNIIHSASLSYVKVGSNISGSIYGLQPSTSYNVRLVAIDADGTRGIPSQPVMIQTAPGSISDKQRP